jgi:hypothetical protein
MTEPKPPPIVIVPGSISSVAAVGTLTVWLSDNFAEDWFRDALHEARTGTDYNAVRREIIFGACFAETYIFEWARRKLQIEEINDYFPPMPRFANDHRYRRTLVKKWRHVPKELFEAKKIAAEPKLNLSGLGQLAKYRHGLVHAAGSRPTTGGQPKKSKPFSTKGDLKKVSAGWAVRIVVDLVSDLHATLGESVPSYLEPP